MLVAEGAARSPCDPVVSLWDVPRPMVIVQEAGGRFTDLSGAATAAGGSAIATNGVLHEPLGDPDGDRRRRVRRGPPRAKARRGGSYSGHGATVRRGGRAGRPASRARPREDGAGADAPLAARMRPRTLDEFVGQEHLLGAGLGAARARSSRAGRTR